MLCMHAYVPVRFGLLTASSLRLSSAARFKHEDGGSGGGGGDGGGGGGGVFLSFLFLRCGTRGKSGHMRLRGFHSGFHGRVRSSSVLEACPQKVCKIMQRLALVGPAIAENPSAVIRLLCHHVRVCLVSVFPESQKGQVPWSCWGSWRLRGYGGGLLTC